MAQIKRQGILFVFIQRGKGNWRMDEGQRQQQVIDGVNTWMEMQTVLHSYQLAVKKEDWLSAKARERERGVGGGEGWQKDREAVPDSSRSPSVQREYFRWRWTLSLHQDCVICIYLFQRETETGCEAVISFRVFFKIRLLKVVDFLDFFISSICSRNANPLNWVDYICRCTLNDYFIKRFITYVQWFVRYFTNTTNTVDFFK